MKKLFMGLAATIYTVFLSGCAAGGATFTKEAAIPSDKGLIYFYRPKAFQGSAIAISVVDNGKEAFKIKNGQFIKYFAEPGKHQFHTDTMAIDRPTELEVEAGKTYYIKTGLNVGMWVGSWTLNRVYEEEALVELKSCKSGEVK